MATPSIAASPPVSGTTPLPPSSSGSSGGSLSSTSGATLAGNFQTFLTLLTTQLQNQNPLDPLDTNQFTQQLVEFASVEQQLKTNDSLSTLVSLEQTAQSTQALTFVGKTAVVNGNTAAVFSGTYAVNAGNNQPFTWNGQGNDGTQWPDGQYTLTATATDSSGNSVGIATQVQGVVSAVDLTHAPPLLTINGQSYTVNQIQSIAN